MKINPDHQLLWIRDYYDSEQNIHLYHIRQVMTEQYKEFYKWHCTKKLHYSMDDWPHDYFVYLNEDDRLEMCEKFARYLEPVEGFKFDKKWYYDHTSVPNPNDMNVIIGNILQDCIDEEINKEVMRTILNG